MHLSQSLAEVREGAVFEEGQGETEHGRAGPGLRLLLRRHWMTGPGGMERAGTPDPPLVPT